MPATEAPADRTSLPFVLRDDSDAVATLTLNRPDSLNALSDEMLDALQETLDAIAGDETVRAVVLRGAGRAFCAGHNLKDMRANYTLEYQQALFAKCSRFMLTVHRMPQPVIARVHGLATAAGCQLVATCDLAVAADDARFATSGINVGLFCTTPGVALGRNVARKHAMEMLLTGEFVSAQRAYEIGLVNRVAPADALDAVVHELATALTAKSAHALMLGKQAFYRQLEMPLDGAYQYAAREMARNMMDRDAAEGVDAFIAKRPPEWDQSRRPVTGDDAPDGA
ncbi:unnamed protein product [Discosporangium mesarthrocarpum]